jgi:hypothetical protein
MLRVSVKDELFSSGLNCVEVATRVQRAVATTISTTTSPAKGNVNSFVFLKDAAVVQNAVAAASSLTPVFALAPISALSGADVAATGLSLNYTIWVYLRKITPICKIKWFHHYLLRLLLHHCQQLFAKL